MQCQDAEGMVLKVFIAHTGQRLLADPGNFISLDVFKVWVSKNSKVDVQDQIHLNVNGKHVKFAGLSKEKEIFIYDRRIVQSNPPRSIKPHQYDIPEPQGYHTSKPPDTISDQNEIEAWKELFNARREWATDVLKDCSRMSDEAQKRRSEIEVIIRAASTAVLNVQKHVTTVDHKNAVIQNWAEDIRKAQESTGMDWNKLLELLCAIPVTNEIIKFITGHETNWKERSTLEGLVNIEKFQKAKNLMGSITRQLSRSRLELREKVEEVYRKSDELVDIVSGHMPKKSEAIASLEPSQLLQDIEALAVKVSLDCENLHESQPSVNVPQVSKCALVHTKTLLPSMAKRSMEMNNLLQSVTQTRNSLVTISMDLMQRIAFLTSMVSEVISRLSTMEPSEEADDAFQTLLDVKLLPVTYASFLAECIRRKQWKEKIMTDSSTLASEMKTFQEEELRRRRKWQKAVGVTLWGKRVEHPIPGMEFNLQGIDDDWPQVTKQYLNELFIILQTKDLDPALANEVSKIISDLDNPTKQQSRRAKAAFKAGSFHENSLGRSTLLVRGDDELIRILQEEVQKTASKLRTAESRVRRLENLLHQQTQVNRTTSGNMFQINNCLPDVQSIPNPTQSPRLPENPSRRSSVSSYRISTNQTPEENNYHQKLHFLEAELSNERERSSNLEKEILRKKMSEEKLKTQIEEANSTKNDLLKNLEAQQREFIEERKSLAVEIKRVQAQKEDLENDLDRFVTSREDEKGAFCEDGQNNDYFIKAVQNEIVVESQEKFLPNTSESGRTDNGNLIALLKKLREENDELILRSTNAEKDSHNLIEIMHHIYKQILPHEEIDTDFNSFIQSLNLAIDRLVSELEFAKNDAIAAKSDRDQFRSEFCKLKSEISQVRDKLSAEESNYIQSTETSAELRSKLAAIETELADERLQLSSLKRNTADIQNDSESLRCRLSEEEQKAICLKEDLANQEYRTEILEKETEAFRDKYQSVQALLSQLTSRFEVRTSKAKDLTQRLFIQNDCLCKLLERLSYSVIREGKSMAIQRLSKPERSNANDSSDPNSTIRRSAPGVSKKRTIISSGELEYINWTQNDDNEAENQKYDNFMSSVGYFDIEAFSETIAKRVKDLEYTAKKYSRDARSYREKSHAAQKEAHEKIAFKNFKEGDLALFLPTRNQATGAWAAFNVGAPHYFLKEQDSHKLRSRDWLLARIFKIEDRVVDLSKSLPVSHLQLSDQKSLSETNNVGDSFEDDNPFELSDGLRWYLIEAAEEKPGAPTTPGLGKSTVASANIDVTGSIRRSKKSPNGGMEGINRTLSKNLHNRRDSNNSKRSLASASSLIKTGSTPADTASLKAAATTRTVEEGSEAHIIRPSSINDENAANGADKVLIPEKNITPSLTDLRATSPARKSITWDSLLSLDFNLESSKNKK